MKSNYTVIYVHLGKGERGKKRKEALEQLATEADCFWGGEPSIGRWLVKMADYKIQEMEDNRMSLREILQNVFNNGRVTSESSQEELEEQFDFEATENGWSTKEIKEAIGSQWFPKL